MTVKEVICEALRLVGREDAADAISGSSSLTSDYTRLNRAFLTYLNSVFDELARGYFPLDARAEITSDGVIAQSAFPYRPVRIKKVYQDGKEVDWQLGSEGLITKSGVVTVVYEYAPDALTEDDEFDYPVFAVGERLVEYGMVAEHYLVLGDAVSSKVWEEKYRDEIEALLSRSTVRERIPPRRWI